MMIYTGSLRTVSAVSALLSVLWLGGCSTLTPGTAPFDFSSAHQATTAQCQQQLSAIQRAVHNEDTGDAQYSPVAGFPTYRTNRFWSAFADQTLTPQQRYYWRWQLHKLGMSSLQQEWHNLPRAERDSLTDFADFSRQCDLPLFGHSLQQPLPTSALEVPDSYNDLMRWLGLYPLLKYAAAKSIAEYQEDMRSRFDTFAGLPAPTAVFAPAASTQVDSTLRAQWLQQAYQHNPLQLPQLDTPQLQALFEHHAPRLEIAQQTDADIPGSARWLNSAPGLKTEARWQRQIDTNTPTLYTYTSYTRLDGQILLQLNYVVWFSERPKPEPDDWYGGKLDGLIWRVTLNTDGSVLMYDSIHPCGCFHTVHLPMASPLRQRIANLQQDALEPVLFFDNTLPANIRPQLELEAGTHYLVQVSAASEQAIRSEYQLRDYDRLRSLPAGDGFRNWFDSDGLIASSARRERYFLWPLGVDSAGAMRQQGHHAIAFVGKRHFDEASLESLLQLPQ